MGVCAGGRVACLAKRKSATNKEPRGRLFKSLEAGVELGASGRNESGNNMTQSARLKRHSSRFVEELCVEFAAKVARLSDADKSFDCAAS